MSITSNHALPLLAAGQAQKHVTLNDALVQLDAIIHMAVESASVLEPPSNSGNGTRLIVPNNGLGSFSQKQGQVAWNDNGAWRFLQPKEGWLTYVKDTESYLSFNGTDWQNLPITVQDRLGININATDERRLSVASGSSLLTNVGQDHRLVINKADTSNTASIVFQNAYAGRAEIGLTGNDQFSLKTTTDGIFWNTTLLVDPQTGYLGVGGITPQAVVHIVADGDVRLLLQPLSGASNRESYIDFGATFDNYSDAYVRQVARIRAGFSGGVWGTEFISFGVGGAFNANDPPIERARLTSMGLSLSGFIRPASYLKSALPSAADAGVGAMVMLTDESGGPVIVFSDGTDWRRMTDRAIAT